MLIGKETITDDQLLWNNFREGDAAAFTILIEKYSNPLFGYGNRFFQDRDFIKDCIQDIFFDLWNRRQHINPTASVKSYLFKCLRLRIFKEKSKWTSSEELADDYCFEIEFNVENKLIEAQTAEEFKLKMSRLMDTLPKRQKEILYLRFYEGLDHNRISHVMGISKQSAYNLLHESIIHLKEAWFQQMVLLAMMVISVFLLK